MFSFSKIHIYIYILMNPADHVKALSLMPESRTWAEDCWTGTAIRRGAMTTQDYDCHENPIDKIIRKI